MDKYISIKEAAELIGVTTTTLRRWRIVVNLHQITELLVITEGMN